MIGLIYLFAAIVLEVSGTTCMKLSVGFAKTIPSILVVVFYGSAITFLTLALKTITVSSAYSIWSGLGTALIAVIGFILFREHVSFVKLISILLIIMGVVGLNLSGMSH